MFEVSVCRLLICLGQRREWLLYLGTTPGSVEAAAVAALGYNPRFEDDIKLIDRLIAHLGSRALSCQNFALPLHAAELGSQTAIYNTVVYALYEYDPALYREFRSQGGSPSS